MAKKNKTYNFTGKTMTDYLAIRQGNLINTVDAFKHQSLFTFPEYVSALEEKDIVHFKVDQKPNGSFNLTNKTVTEQIRLSAKLTNEGNAKRDRFYQQKKEAEKPSVKKENTIEQHNNEQAKKIIKEEVKEQTGAEPVLANVPDEKTRIDGLPEEELKVVAEEKVRQEVKAEVEERQELHESIKKYIAEENLDTPDFEVEGKNIEATHRLLTTGERTKDIPGTELLEEERMLIQQIGSPERFQTRYGMEMLGGKFIPTSHNMSLAEATKDPDAFRENFHSFKEKLDHYISNVQQDHQRIRDTISILKEAKNQKVSLADILLGNDPDGIYKTQRASTMAKRVYANLAFGGNMNEMNQALGKGIDIIKVTNDVLKNNTQDVSGIIRYQFANILSSTHMNEPLFFQKEDYTVTKNGKDMLLHNLQNINGNAQDPNGRSYPVYHEALATRREIKRIYSMIDEHRKDVQNQEASYIDTPSHSDGTQEAYNENKKIVDEEERKEVSLKRTEKVMAEEERKPRSPITGFKNAVDQSLSVELNISEDTVELAKQARLNYETALAQKELELAEQAKIPPPPKEKFVLEPLQTFMAEIETKQRLIDRKELELQRILERETKRYTEKESTRYAMEKAQEFLKKDYDASQTAKSGDMRQVVQLAMHDIKERPHEMMAATKQELLLDDSSEYKRLYEELTPHKEELESLKAKQEVVEYHSPLKATQEAGTPDPHSVDEIIKNYGWVPEMGESPEYIKSVQDAMDVLEAKENKESMGIKTTKIEPIAKNTEYRNKWAEAIKTHSSVQLPKDSVGYKAIGISGRDVVLRAENILVDNLQFAIDAFTREEKTEILTQIDNADKRTYGISQVTEGIMTELQSGPPKEGFVEVIFDAKPLDKNAVLDLGEYVGKKLIDVDDGLKEKFDVQAGKKSVVISKDNLSEIMTKHYGLIGLSENEIANKKELPSYIVKMLQSHARFIAEDTDVVATAMLAYEDTINELAARGGTLDVTDDTITRKWMEANYGIGDLTDEQQMEVKAFKETLQGRTVTERLQDATFMDVLQRAHTNFFAGNAQKGAEGQYDFLMKEVARVYQQKFPDTSHMSVNTMVEIIHSKELDDMFNEYSHYQGIRKMTPQQMQDAFLDGINQELDGMPISINDSLNHLEVKEVDDGPEVNIDRGVYEDENVSSVDKRIVIEGGIENFDDYDRIKEDELLDPNKEYVRQIIRENENEKTIRIQGGQNEERYVGTKNIGMLLDIEQERGNERLKGMADLGGNIGHVEIEVYKGSAGELLGYVPSLSRTFGIAESTAEGIRTLNMDIAAPRIKRDAPHVDMYKQGDELLYNASPSYGNVTQIEKDPIFWPEMQRSGAYRIDSDPGVASRNLAKFVMGKQQLAYVDVESTGLLGSTIPSKHIQPLEIHAEKIQWDTENARIMRDEQGNTVIKTRNGNDTHRSMTRYIGVTDENRRFMDDIIATEDFTFSYDVKTIDPVTNQAMTVTREYSVLDFLGEQGLAETKAIKDRKIYNEILQQENFQDILQNVQEKTDKLWYLRNVAKYAWLGEELASGSIEQRQFDMHAGNEILPSIAGVIKQHPYEVDPVGLAREQQFNYLDTLIQDAQEGTSRLSVASKGSPVKVARMDTAIKQVANFLGKTPVIGVNVGDADIGMLLHGAETIMDSKVSYNMQTLNITDADITNTRSAFVAELDEVRNDLFEQLKTFTGQSQDDSMLQFKDGDKTTFSTVDSWIDKNNKNEAFNRRREVEKHRPVNTKDARELVGRIRDVESVFEAMQQQPLGVVGEEQLNVLMAEGADTSMIDAYRSLSTNQSTMTPEIIEQIQQQYVGEIDDVRANLFEELKTTTGQTQNDAILSFNDTSKGSYKNVVDWFDELNQSIEAKREAADRNGYRTIGAKQAEDLTNRIKQIETIFNEVEQNPFGSITPEYKEILANEGVDLGVVDSYMTTMTDNQNMSKAMQKIENREIIDQQYASTYLNPEMPSHTADAQAKKNGIDKGNQHLAVDDVRTGIQVVERHARGLLNDPGFQDYMNQPRKRNYRAGDIVEMTKAVDKNPRGVYQIDTLLPESGEATLRRIDDGSDAMIQLSGIDPQEFARKMNTHFEWVGQNDKQAQSAIAEFDHDQSRRQVQRTIEHPFKFELSGLQSAGQYRENLGNLVNALDSAIAKTTAYESALTQVDHPITGERIDAYDIPDVTKRREVPEPEYTPLERIALQNQAMLSSPKTLDILNEDITPSRQKALDASTDFMDSAVGHRYRSFFDDVERLQDTGVIGGARSAEMVKEWNEAIKTKAMEAGATRPISNNYNLGNLTFQTADKDVTFDNVRLDLSSRQATKKSLDNLFNRVQGFAGGDTYEERLNSSFKNHILPFLNQQGLVDPTSLPLEAGDTVRTAAIAENIHQAIAANNPVLTPFEQFDPLALKSFNDNPEFLSFMEGLQKEMTGEYIENLSPMQWASWKDIDRQEQDLRNMNAYIPNLKITVDADIIRPQVLDTLALGRHGGVIDNATTRELIEYANTLANDANLKDRFAFDSRNAIYNALTYRATEGKNISGQIDDIIRESPNGDQVEAMRALNWIVDNPDANSSQPYIQNPNYDEYIFGSGAGKDSNYNGRTMAEIDMQTLHGMMDTHVTDYTRNDHRQFFHNVATKYAEQNYPNHVGGEQAPFLRLEDGPLTVEQASGTEYRRTEMANKNDQLKEQAAQQGARNPHEGADHSVLPQGDTRQHYSESMPQSRVFDPPTAPREDGLVEKWVRNRKNDIGNVVEQLDMGPGGGGRWIAGLGVAALALSMFHNAGSPIKLEDRPEGHGVAGTNGSVQDEVQFGDQGQAPQSPKPSTGGSAYVNTGEKGYVVKGKGQATSSINPRDMENQMKNMGGNATIRMKDERNNLDRNWLQTKFDDYINRGHVE